MKRSLLYALAIFVIAGIFVSYDLLVDTASLTLVNESTETIGDLAVKVWDKEFVLGSLAPGDSKRISLCDYSDTSWKISGRWNSGDQIREQVGYITRGMDFTDQVVFAPDRKLVFSSGPR